MTEAMRQIRYPGGLRAPLAAVLYMLAGPGLAADATDLFYAPPDYSYTPPSHRYTPPAVAPERDFDDPLPGSQRYVEACSPAAAGYDPQSNTTLDAEGRRVPCRPSPGDGG